MKINYRHLVFYCFVITLISMGCKDDPDPNPSDMGVDLTDIPYNTTPVEIEYPEYIIQLPGITSSPTVPQMPIPDDNLLTEEGIDLGRHLFYDKLLSADFTMSCSSCHLPEGAFTDNKATSIGIDGINGRRSSMSLFNIGWVDRGLFWDGRSLTLEEQAILPVEDPIELHNNWDEVEQRLKESDLYPEKFRKAFGISNSNEITKELATKAIAQFERSIYSFNSKFDRFLKGELFLEDEELYGLEMFVEAEGVPDAQCIHCHNIPMTTSNDFFNNGLQEADASLEFDDNGLGVFTVKAQNGFFRAPTLRNIALTAPYMHDGSLSTLEEVMDHYASGGKNSPTKDPLLDDIQLSEYDKQALIAFLHTLTDTTIIFSEALSNPFD